MNPCPPYRSTFVHYASDAWLRQTVTVWETEGIPEHTLWFWIRDVREVISERELINGNPNVYWVLESTDLSSRVNISGL